MATIIITKCEPIGSPQTFPDGYCRAEYNAVVYKCLPNFVRISPVFVVTHLRHYVRKSGSSDMKYLTVFKMSCKCI